jgi:hypothetical protein
MSRQADFVQMFSTPGKHMLPYNNALHLTTISLALHSDR